MVSVAIASPMSTDNPSGPAASTTIEVGAEIVGGG